MSKANDRSGDAGFYTTSQADIFLVLLIIGFSVFTIFGNIQQSIQQSPVPCRVIIYHGTEPLKECDLSRDAIVPILNGKMTIEIKSGRVRVLESDCPQHTCMLTGWKKYAGQSILCLPNHIVIELKATVPALLDAVAY